MSDVEQAQLEPGETLEARIGSCRAMLSRSTLTNHDCWVVQKMLTSAQVLKQKKEGHLHKYLDNFVHATGIVLVDVSLER